MNKIVMNKRKWNFFSTTALIVAFAIFAGSFLLVRNMKENVAGPAPARVTAKIISEMHYSNMIVVSQSQLSKHYSIPDAVITDSSLYMSKSSDNAAELACFLLTDKSKFSELKSAVTSHINSKAAGFKSLNPAQYTLLKNYVIVQQGKYVLVSVGNNASSDEKLFVEILN
nr:DUF4358 domain-containing protein [uncultured Caproiciproducens sp.]